MNGDNTISIAAAVVIALAIARWLFSDTLTTHWIYTKSGAPAVREVYSVDRSSLTVTVMDKWSLGTGLAGGPYTGCAVVDSRNWRCREAGVYASDGHVKEDVLSADMRLREVSGFRWWIARLTHWSYPEEEVTQWSQPGEKKAK
jgi:hypothetical protein